MPETRVIFKLLNFYDRTNSNLSFSLHIIQPRTHKNKLDVTRGLLCRIDRWNWIFFYNFRLASPRGKKTYIHINTVNTAGISILQLQ
jgi:hypothetical protein